MKLSTKGKYAVEAMCCLAVNCEEGPKKVRELSDKTGITEGYLEQLFFRLRKAGLLTTGRGQKGGYLLARPAGEITVGEILRAVEGELVPVACIRDPSLCQSAMAPQCATRPVWTKLAGAIDAVADGVTLSSLAQSFLKEEVE